MPKLTEEQRDNLLLKMDERLSKHDEMFIKISEDMNSMKEDMDNMKADIKGIHENIDDMKEDIENIQANIGSLDKKTDKLQKEVRRMSGSIAVIENDHGGKIQMLLETTTQKTMDNTELNQMLDSHEKELYEHDIRIRVLESKAEKAKVGNL